MDTLVEEALPDARYISDFISDNSENLNKAKRLIKHRAVTLKKLDKENGVAEFAVQSESSDRKKYKVVITDFNTDGVTASCNCPYDWGDECKHILAGMLALQSLMNLKSRTVQRAETFRNHQSTENVVAAPVENIVLPFKNIDTRQILQYMSWQEMNNAMQLNRNGQAILKSLQDGKAQYEVIHKKKSYDVVLVRPDAEHISICCTCDYPGKICIHVTAALFNMNVRHGAFGLNLLKDSTADKSKLLAQYGYTLKDDLTGKFEFELNHTGIIMKVLDASIHPLPGTESWYKWKKNFLAIRDDSGDAAKPPAEPGNHQLIFCFAPHGDSQLPDVSFNALIAKSKKSGGFYKKIETYIKYHDKDSIIKDAVDEQLIELSSRLDSKTILSATAGNTFSNETIADNSVNEKDRELILRYTGSLLNKLFEAGAGKTVYIVNGGSSYNYYYNQWAVEVRFDEPLVLSNEKAVVEIKVTESEEYIEMEPCIQLNEKTYKLKSFRKLGRWMLIRNNIIYKIADYADLHIIHQFGDQPVIRFRTKDFQHIFNEMIQPLTRKVKVTFPQKKQETIESLKPVANLYLKEYDKFLLLTPRFEYAYNDWKEEAELNSTNDFIFHKDNSIVTVKRDRNTEREYTDFFSSLHPDFSGNNREFYYISFDKIMQRGWFFDLFDKLKEKNIQVFGRNELTKIKYNVNRPTMQMRSSSGIDWFDLQIQISFGDLEVSLHEIRKAFINRQMYVPLSDGTIGILPEEWVERYASLFKMGRIEDDAVRVSKLHFTIIDALEKEIDNEKILMELQEKKKKLLQFEGIEEIPMPKNMKVQLRDYQQKGFHWLNFLNEFGWGGCLADDMGLGKTVQVLTLLQHLKNKNEAGTSLVVVPTTLIFNWQEEVKKFCHKMKVHVHRGTERNDDTKEFPKYDIILTTYGTLRSDIELFKSFEFNYVILDESQAIKNTTAQVSRAVRLLNAKHRLAMTGTPVENNTFDLYSQLEFLNPGFLGSQEFFREEFANAVDKHGDEKKAEQLRRMITPFVLKRTKEDVATDLPAKTETVLYCEMGKSQRKVYDTIQKKYKQEILEKINEEGLSKSGFLILEGLLKLRQICDSPVLISDEENNYGEESAKLEELVREISENAGHHKILVFSQFLKMLDLVKQKLEALNIPYTYLDGQTVDRKEKVDSFQQDDHVRVFLISLRAGGVGINLTEADYVYLVDPWWNPAVERQAIDRTHRIGQKKKVFAYKMICKDTVEEKIIKLQEKKKFVASSLIEVDKNVLKKLSKEDIAELFS